MGRKLSVTIAILAHNEEGRIASCLNSLPIDQADLNIHVIVNGSQDKTAEIANEIAARHANIMVHNWPEGGKSRSWNRFVFDCVDQYSDAHIFVDGDAYIKSGSVDALVTTLFEKEEVNAAAGMPLNGRNVAFYQKEMQRMHGIFGDLYAVKGSFLQKMKDQNIRLPNDLVGDDALIGALAKCDLKDEASWDDSRVAICKDAGFYCAPFQPLDFKTWKTQYYRMINYSVRHFQNSIISKILGGAGALGLPSELSSIYAAHTAAFKPRRSFPAFWFDRKALTKINKAA